MKVAVIKYNAGNIQSVTFGLERLSVDFSVTDQPEEIMQADKVIFPGVGEASSTMNYLKDKRLDKVITNLTQPVLGICLGMQLLCKFSEENNTHCLGIFDDSVKKFIAKNQEKIPHIGWNQITNIHDWIDSSLENKSVYYVHSYYVPVNIFTIATTNYITPFSAAMKKDNFHAVQFHPEKSADIGERILKNFLNV